MRRGIVVVAPAWHSCGSYEVFKNQIETFKSLGYATYFLAVSRKAKAWQHPAGYWEHYLKMTPDIAPDFRGETGQSNPLLAPHNLRNVVLPALAKSVVTWRALPAMLAPVPQCVRDFVAGCDHVDIVCNYYFNMPLAERIKALKPGTRIILETHDIQSRQFLDQKLVHPVTQRTQNYNAMLNEEIAYYRRADILVHLNGNEAEEFSRVLPEKRHELVFPTVQRANRSGEAPIEIVEPFDFLIVMSATYSNCVSLYWFFENVWSPAFDRQCSLKIAGTIDQLFRSKNETLFRNYSHRFLGRIPALEPYYQSATAVLLPVVQGHGISVKMIEAMSYGKPIITTRHAFRGFDKMLELDTLPGLANTPEEFQQAMLTCAKHGHARTRFCLNAIREKLFGQEAFRIRYREVLER